MEIKLTHYLSFGNLAAAQATGADPHALVARLGFSVYRAQIDVPAPPGDVMRVTDVVAELRAFAADFTNLGHVLTPENCQTGWVNIYDT